MRAGTRFEGADQTNRTDFDLMLTEEGAKFLEGENALVI